jgi:hypothetical protein
MFRLISGHPQAHSWSLKHIEEEMYVTLHTTKVIKIIANCYGHKQEQYLWTEVLPQTLSTYFAFFIIPFHNLIM